MATAWASLNRPFSNRQSSGSESYVFLYSQLALDWGKRTMQIDRKVEDAHMSRGKPTRWYAQLQALEAKADRATFAGVASLGSGGRFDPLA